MRKNHSLRALFWLFFIVGLLAFVGTLPAEWFIR